MEMATRSCCMDINLSPSQQVVCLVRRSAVSSVNSIISGKENTEALQ